MDIKSIWENQGNDTTLTPPPQNSYAEAAYNGMIYNIDFLGNLTYAIPIDRGIVELLQRKTLPFTEDNKTRQLAELTLLGRSESFKVKVWIIPLFLNGVLCNHLYAADDENQAIMLEHRNPTKKEENGPYYI